MPPTIRISDRTNPFWKQVIIYRGQSWGHLDPTDEIFDFFASMSEYVEVKEILEFGTNSCFSSMMQLEVHPNATITTFDPTPWRVESGVKDKSYMTSLPVGEIRMPDVAKFYYGDRFLFRKDKSTNIKSYLKRFPDNGVGKYDYAFVDGDHSYEVARQDIQNCLDLDIEYIIVDNLVMLPEVTKAVAYFVDLNLIEEVKRIKYIQTHPTEGTQNEDHMGLYKKKNVS